MNSSRGATLVLIFALIIVACSPSEESVETTSIPEPSTTTVAPSGTTTAAPSTTTTLSKAARDAGWLEDLDTFWERLPATHPNPFWRTPEEEFEAEIEELKATVPTLGDDEIELELIRIVALIDGHSALSTTFPGIDYHRLQIRLYEFADGVFVVEADDANLIGARVISINGMPIEDAFQRVHPYVSRDNDQNLKNVTPLYVIMPEILEGAGITEPREVPTFLVETRAGEQTETAPRALEAATWSEWVESPVNLPAREGLLADERAAETFWFTYLEEERTIYFQYNQVGARSEDPDTGETVSLDDLVQDMRETASSREVNRIVVDVRRNPGGNNTTFGPLVDFLMEQDEAEIDLVVITGRQTFSAAANFSTILDIDTNAVFVGEGMGGRPNLYGDVSGIRLPNSGLAPEVSTRYWEFGGPGDDRETIEPDFTVDLLSSQYFGNLDPALETALTVELP